MDERRKELLLRKRELLLERKNQLLAQEQGTPEDSSEIEEAVSPERESFSPSDFLQGISHGAKNMFHTFQKNYGKGLDGKIIKKAADEQMVNRAEKSLEKNEKAAEKIKEKGALSRIAHHAGEFAAGAAIPFPGTGIAKTLTKVAPVGAVLGATSGALQEQGVDPTVADLATIGASVVAPAVGRKALSKLSLNEEAIKSFAEAGIPYGWADVTNSKKIHADMDKLLKRTGGRKRVAKHFAEQQKAVEKGLGNIEHEALPEGKREDLFVKGASEYLAKEKAKHSRRYDKHAANVKKLDNSTIDLKATQEWLDNMSPTVRADFTKNSKAKGFLKDLLENKADTVDYDQPLREIMEKVNKNPSSAVDYDLATRKLSEIGSRVRTNKAQKNLEEGEVAHLYGLLKQDIDQSIAPRLKKQLGEAAYKNWKNMRGYYKNFQEQDVPHINALLKNAVKNDANKYIARGYEHEISKDFLADIKTGARGFEKVLEATSKPEEKKKLVKSIFDMLGHSKDGFNIATFATNFSKLTPKTQNKLLKPLGKAEASTFKNTLEVIKNSKLIKSQANFPNTAHHIESDLSNDKLRNAFLGSVLGHATDNMLLGGAGVAIAPLIRNLKARAYTSKKIPEAILNARQKKGINDYLLQAAFGNINNSE